MAKIEHARLTAVSRSRSRRTKSGTRCDTGGWRDYSHIGHCLDDQTASLITHAFINSRLEYANSILLGSPNYVINKLQRIQNSFARIVLQSDCQAHSEPLLRQLHWLPVQSRIRFKLATITDKALYTNSPQYLASLIYYHQPVRSLRSSNQHYHLPTKCTTNFGSRTFRCSAPAIWNSIPLVIRSLQTIDAFKRGLKLTTSASSCMPRSSSPRALDSIHFDFIARKYRVYIYITFTFNGFDISHDQFIKQ